MDGIEATADSFRSFGMDHVLNLETGEKIPLVDDEEQLKERCREIFYAAIQERINEANELPSCIVLDYVWGNHRIQEVIW